MDFSLGDTHYSLGVTEHDGRFTAHALRGPLQERFGIETVGSSAEEALGKLTRWLEWQHEHTEALAALQAAERQYHRAMTGAAFSTSLDGAADAESRTTLSVVDAARQHLDEVRARRPHV